MSLAQNPDTDVVQLAIVNTGKVLRNWVSYRANSHWLTPTDGWTFTVSVSEVSNDLRKSLVTGAAVSLSINGSGQAAGYIDSVEYSQDSSGGINIEIEGRDALSPAVDSHCDPRKIYKENSTLDAFLRDIFGGFGFTNFKNSDLANRGVLTGTTSGIKSSKKGKPLNGELLHQLKPYPNEGVYGFASRVAERHGLYIWVSADGDTILVDTPDYTSDPLYSLNRRIGVGPGSRNNILSGSVKRDATDQPNVIFAYGDSFGGEFAHSRLKAAAINPYYSATTTDSLIANYKGVQVLGAVDPILATPMSQCRPLYLHDPNAHTQDNLANFARREMGLRARKALTCRYVVPGHSSNGNIWAVNTIADVRDDIGDVNEAMWILSRTFMKSTHGTFTELELCRLNSVVF